MSKYTAIDILRKENKHNNVVDLSLYDKEADSFETYLEQKETRSEILSEINKFDKENKEIFLKRFFLNYSIKDISKITNISENAISNRLRRLRLKLIDALKREVI
jgi:RNA polymerase sigma-70 factor (ECF subfamily)